MTAAVASLRRALSQGPVTLVKVQRVQGSGPREEGAWMAVSATEVINTIGGGHLEFQAIAQARALLDTEASTAPLSRQSGSPDQPLTVRYALGPSLGQCCGGVVHLQFQKVDASHPEVAPLLQPSGKPLALFGGGHVGRAIVQALAPLPYRLRWIDSRDEIFPDPMPANTEAEHCEPVHDAVADLEPGTAVLIMSFSHAEDLDIVAACLRRLRQQNDLPYVGLIGSATKWATFRHRLAERGFGDDELARITCPIGIAGIPGKQPEVIAVAVVAQLLMLT